MTSTHSNADTDTESLQVAPIDDYALISDCQSAALVSRHGSIDWYCMPRFDNEYGGKENVPAVEFLRKLNESIYRDFPDVQTIAEDSTDWPMVSRPAYVGGLGFGMKWKMGWMHDTLEYIRLYVCAPWQETVIHGGEFGQWNEWNHESSPDWQLLDEPAHRGIQAWVRDLNHFYREQPAMHQLDFSDKGFEWVDFHDALNSVITFIRKGSDANDMVLVVCNFTPLPRENYIVGIPRGGRWREVLNSDAKCYGGTGFGNAGGVDSVPVPAQGRCDSLYLTLPPLGVLYLKPDG